MAKHISILVIALTGLSLIILPPIINAGQIDDWNRDNVTVQPGSYILKKTYLSRIFTDTSKSISNGAVIWVESDVKAPGMQVVNNLNGVNCIMSSGIDLVITNLKNCTDPFQTSKRFKLASTAGGKTVDLVFNVSDTENKSTYRVLEKYINMSGTSLAKFKVLLGFGTGDNFVSSTSGDGLGFSDENGIIWKTSTETGDISSKELDALFPFGLFGDASTDVYHTIDGYFDTGERAGFALRATEDLIVSNGISNNYSSRFGDWLDKSRVPYGFSFNHDNDADTEAPVVAHLTSKGWVSLRPAGFIPGWRVPDTNPDGTVSAATIAAWQADKSYIQGPIEDLSNLNLNYYITLDNISDWHTNNFTLRIISQSDEPVIELFPSPHDGYKFQASLIAAEGGSGGRFSVILSDRNGVDDLDLSSLKVYNSETDVTSHFLDVIARMKYSVSTPDNKLEFTIYTTPENLMGSENFFDISSNGIHEITFEICDLANECGSTKYDLYFGPFISLQDVDFSCADNNAENSLFVLKLHDIIIGNTAHPAPVDLFLLLANETLSSVASYNDQFIDKNIDLPGGWAFNTIAPTVEAYTLNTGQFISLKKLQIPLILFDLNDNYIYLNEQVIKSLDLWSGALDTDSEQYTLSKTSLKQIIEKLTNGKTLMDTYSCKVKAETIYSSDK